MNAAQNRRKVFERVGVQLQNTQYQPTMTVEEACIEYASLYAFPADYLQLLEQFGLLPLIQKEAETRCPIPLHIAEHIGQMVAEQLFFFVTFIGH